MFLGRPKLKCCRFSLVGNTDKQHGFSDSLPIVSRALDVETLILQELARVGGERERGWSTLRANPLSVQCSRNPLQTYSHSGAVLADPACNNHREQSDRGHDRTNGGCNNQQVPWLHQIQISNLNNTNGHILQSHFSNCFT